MTSSSSSLKFGPPSAQWSYTPHTKTYDLSRGLAPILKVAATEGPPGVKVEVSVELAAVVVVDMQNFFLSEKCRQHPLGLAAIEPTIRVIEKCREIGMQVIWLNWGLTDTDMATMPAGVQRGFSRSLIEQSHSPNVDPTQPIKSGLGSDLGDGKGRTLFAGSWNADIHPELKVHVRPEDVHCAKNRMSGLWSEEQPLWKYISGNGEGGKRKETLFFTGVNTDQCVLGTLSNAYNAGWDCIMINDCCATTTDKGKEVCVHNIASSYGFIVESDTFCAGTVS